MKYKGIEENVNKSYYLSKTILIGKNGELQYSVNPSVPFFLKNVRIFSYKPKFCFVVELRKKKIKVQKEKESSDTNKSSVGSLKDKQESKVKEEQQKSSSLEEEEEEEEEEEIEVEEFIELRD